MRRSLILIEFKNITTAFYVLNELIENVDLKVVVSKLLCPGRYILIFSGSLGEVSQGAKIVEEIKQDSKHSNISIIKMGSVEQGIIEKINIGIKYPEKIRGLGIVETTNSVEIIRIADTLYKSGDIKIISIKVGIGLGAKGVILIEGSETDLYNGISQSGISNNKKVISSHIINTPDKMFLENFKF